MTQPPEPPLRRARALHVFWLLTLGYVAALVFTHHGQGLGANALRLLPALPLLMLISLASFSVRYARFAWLLARAGFRFPLLLGFAGYLCGFAFSATPGKVGELVRIRYFRPMAVPPDLVVSSFLYERSFDLVVVLVLAGLTLAHAGVFQLAVAFVACVVCVVVVSVRYAAAMQSLVLWLRSRQWPRLATCVDVLAQGCARTRVWLTPLDVTVSLLAGTLAWGLTAYAFVVLLAWLGLQVPVLSAMALYPLATLAGAATLTPGGVGATEAVLLVSLAKLGVGWADGTLAVVGIRLGTLWFATVLGLAAMAGMDWRARRNGTG